MRKLVSMCRHPGCGGAMPGAETIMLWELWSLGEEVLAQW
jgi:hypothetical protein